MSTVTTGTTGSGCECESPENPELDHIAELTDPPNMHASCCDGCHFREPLAKCIVAVECSGDYNFLVEWATCNGESDVCADHGIAADPGLNSGLTGSTCGGEVIAGTLHLEECESFSETESACCLPRSSSTTSETPCY